MDHKGQRHLIASGGVHGHDPDETLLKSWSATLSWMNLVLRCAAEKDWRQDWRPYESIVIPSKSRMQMSLKGVRCDQLIYTVSLARLTWPAGDLLKKCLQYNKKITKTRKPRSSAEPTIE